MKTWNLSLFGFLILAGCSTIPTVWLSEDALLNMPDSAIDPIVLQFNIVNFFISDTQYYTPNNPSVKYLVLGLKSDNIRKNLKYDFTRIQVRFASGVRPPVAYHYFAGDFPLWRFSMGGGTNVSEADFGGGEGRYTVILGYFYEKNEVPLALVYNDMETPIPEEKIGFHSIWEGFPISPPRTRSSE